MRGGSISRTQLTHTASLIGGKPWKQFRGWKARMRFDEAVSGRGRQKAGLAQPILAGERAGQAAGRHFASGKVHLIESAEGIGQAAT